jgi:hypothetical protein
MYFMQDPDYGTFNGKAHPFMNQACVQHGTLGFILVSFEKGAHYGGEARESFHHR